MLMRRFDVSIMFCALWLLATLVIDAVTPKELTRYMIAGTMAPGFAILAALYWVRFACIDFWVIGSTLWLVSVMVLELISPVPLAHTIIAAAFLPAAVVGVSLNFVLARGRS